MEWLGPRTRLVNGCDAPLLVDQSVALPVPGRMLGHVPAGETVELRDLSGFTVGYQGELYAVRAVFAEVPEAADRAHAEARSTSDTKTTDEADSADTGSETGEPGEPGER